jgi:16S rRNA (adenine1518-N6/adenine1519-N6)-dimethyltransferase
MQKKFGQNFLINSDARRRLAEALDAEAGAVVWEVGPGLGAMTGALLEKGLRVRAFEIDRGFIAALQELFPDRADLSVIIGDALKTWPGQAKLEKPDYFFGNLPYNIAAVLIGNLIQGDCLFKRSVVTVQKEVARRMVASPGSEDYSSFSVLCASKYKMTSLMVLKGASFYPEPHVDSQAVRMELREDPESRSYSPLFQPLVRALFASRRKTIRNNLQAFIGTHFPSGGQQAQDAALAAISDSGLKENERAERLGVEDFARLARAVEDSI